MIKIVKYIPNKTGRKKSLRCVVECNGCKNEIERGFERSIENNDEIYCRSCVNKRRTLKKESIYKHPLYKKFKDMKSRCYTKTHKWYDSYGGRGIKIHQEWIDDTRTFIKWGIKNGWSKELSIDRIDNNGDYSPQNCRFINASEQQHNKRMYKNNKTGYRGVCEYKATGEFQATIMNNGEQKHLGFFDTTREAAIAYNNYIIENKLTHTLNIV